MVLAAAVVGMLSVVLIGGTWLLTNNAWLRCAAGLASICAGYLAYEFGDVMRAILPAFRYAKSQMQEITDFFSGFFSGFGKWLWSGIIAVLKKPHPFAYLMMVLVATFLIYDIVHDIRYGMIWHNVRTPITEVGILHYIGIVSFAGFFLWGIPSLILYALAMGGALWEGKRWSEEFGDDKNEMVAFTYKNGYRWLLKGILYVVWGIWLGVLGVCTFIWKFAKELVRIIHSNERMMIAIDGPGGGLSAMGCFWLYNYITGSTSATMLDYGLVVLFGGIFAAATVVVNVRYVAPRFGYNLLQQNG